MYSMLYLCIGTSYSNADKLHGYYENDNDDGLYTTLYYYNYR